MSSPSMRRSQVILRMPVDHVTASMILHDGERSEVVLFIPPTEDVATVMGRGDPFVPMLRDFKSCLVARDAISCLEVPLPPARVLDDEMPVERQPVVVKLRSGTMVEGELRWVGTGSEHRTLDHLNRAGAYLELYGPSTKMYIRSAHVAIVEER